MGDLSSCWAVGGVCGDDFGSVVGIVGRHTSDERGGCGSDSETHLDGLLSCMGCKMGVLSGLDCKEEVCEMEMKQLNRLNECKSV